MEEGNAFLSQVLDVSLPDSYSYHVAVLALNCTATGDSIRRRILQTSKEGDNGPQRLDATFQRLFLPDSSRHALLDHLGVLFCMPLSSIGDLPDPDEAISMLEAIVASAPENHPGKPFWLHDLGRLLLTRYGHSGRTQDLEESILMTEEASRLTADDDPRKPERRRALYDALMTRYQLFGDFDDLEKSVTALWQ
ncbi:hypothetical protein JVU11DRAFT_10300 [Chiua virens]|nr:hypothetical protein JVU11DRAFT_10300 [Chiua virens]